MTHGRIVVSYAGAHQAYQLALAAQELGELKTFYCALYDDSSKWGARFAEYVGQGLMVGRRAEGLDLQKVIEFPWPLLIKVARDRIYTRGKGGWLFANSAFDWWISQRLTASPPRIFIGTATSDLHCLKALKRKGTFLLHDCPGVHPKFEASLLREAADKAGIRYSRRLPSLRPDMMQNRKLREYALADALMVYSEIHRKSFLNADFSATRLLLCPLWADSEFGRLNKTKMSNDAESNTPLKLLYVGPISLLKGIPFLLQAIDACGNAVQLTIVGPGSSLPDAYCSRNLANVRIVPAQSKSELRDTYASHDLLVLPSVVDSFGIVALEAMASGLPVILTENCGAPVPDPSWRVPAMDADSLARRIMVYADDRTLIHAHREQASNFAARFTVQAYRQQIQHLLRSILEGSC